MGNGILIKEKVNEIIEENYRMASLLSRLFVDHVLFSRWSMEFVCWDMTAGGSWLLALVYWPLVLERWSIGS